MHSEKDQSRRQTGASCLLGKQSAQVSCQNLSHITAEGLRDPSPLCNG